MMPTKSNAALGWAEAAATGGGAPRLRRGAGGGGGLCQGARRRLLRAGKPRISPKQEAGGRGPPKRVVVPLVPYKNDQEGLVFRKPLQFLMGLQDGCSKGASTLDVFVFGVELVSGWLVGRGGLM